MKRSLPVLGGSRTAPAVGGPLGVLAGKRFVVTGGSGFPGAHVVEHARSQGADVVVRTVAELLAEPSLTSGDALVHLAAAPDRAGTSEALLRAAKGHAARFVHVGSVEVYGFPTDLPVREDHPLRPVTAAGEAEAKAETRLRELAPALGVPLVVVRPASPYGPEDRAGAIAQLVSLIERNRFLAAGRGDNLIHATHVDDVAHGVALAAVSEAALGEDFLLCGPETATVGDLSRQIADLLGRWLPPVRVPLGVARLLDRGTGEAVPPVLSRSLRFDGDKARRLLGFVPQVTYREGLARTLRTRVSRGR